MAWISIRPVDPARPGPFGQYLLPGVLAGAPPDAVTVLGAVWDNLACGAAAVRWDRAEIASLFVDPQVRGLGVGGRMVDLLLEEAARRGVEALDADYTLGGEELAAMDALCRRRGGNPLPLSRVYQADTGRFHHSPAVGCALSPGYRPHPSAVPFSRLPSEALDALEADGRIPPLLRPSASGDRMDPALSVAWLRDGRAGAYLLCGEAGPGGYALLAAWRGPDALAAAFLILLRAQLNRCYYRQGGDFLYSFSTLGGAAEALAKRIVGGRCNRYEEHTAALPAPVPSVE